MFLEIIIVWITLGLAAYAFAMFDLRKYFTSQDDEEEERTRLLTAERIPDQDSESSSSSYWYSDVDRIEIFFQSTNKDVRNFINEFVCNEIGDINATPIHQLYDHPKYETVFRKFHSQLKSTLVLLESRLASAQNEDSTIDPEAGLKELQELISTINYYIMDHLPTFPNACKSAPRTTSYAMLIPSYEDLLSTSILNRIILSSQEQQRNASHSPDSAVQTGSDFNTEDSSDQNSIQTDKVERWVTTTTTAVGKTVTSSDEDDTSERSNSTPDDKTKWTNNNKIVIEEHIEEIIINSYQNDDDEALDLEEMGVMGEEVDAGDLEDENDSNDKSWEDNWLFKKKKNALKSSGNQKQPVSMFIPNPSTVHLPSEEAEPELEENEENEVPVEVSSSEDEIEDEKIEPQIHNPHIITVEIHSSPPQVNESTQVAEDADRPPYSLESTHETMRETSQSLIASNDTLEVEAKVETLEATPIFAHEFSMESATTVVTSYQSVTVTKETKPPAAFEKLDTESSISSEESPQIRPPIPMRIAEREKQKWNNPVKITNNPYAPENLTKRINKNTFLNYGDKVAETKVTAEFEFAETSLPGSLNKINRDYYVNSENISLPPERNSQSSIRKEPSPSPTKEKMVAKETEAVVNVNALNESSRSSSSSDLNEIKLPSVKNLAMMFSDSSKGEAKPTPIKRAPPRRVFETKPATKEIPPVLEDKSDPTHIPFEFIEIPKTESPVEEKSPKIASEVIPNATEVNVEPQSTPEPDSSELSRTETPLETDSNDDSISVENSAYGTEDEVVMRVHSPEPEFKTPTHSEFSDTGSGIGNSSGARAVIAKLEKLNQDVVKKPVVLPRGNYMKQKYGLDTDDEMKSPMKAMEFFASQEIRKSTPVEPDEDQRRLRRNILREMRTSKGASGKFDE